MAGSGGGLGLVLANTREVRNLQVITQESPAEPTLPQRCLLLGDI